jgi:hypothetical protein
MNDYDDNSIGPIGAADRNLLVAVAQYYHRPAVLEYGSAEGHSARAWLDAGARLVHCVDVWCSGPMQNVIASNPERVTFYGIDQTAFRPQASYDIIFIDASHHLETNIATLKAAQGAPTSGGCVVIHDTAKWAAEAMTDAHRAFPGAVEDDGGKWHQPDEVRFVEWMRGQGWNCVSLASATALRHGITLCQI